ncbi:hypothetical protein [Halorubrum aethiopicum]|uniref:hypothetical protein n=1 Tax=Halorubrum aethiopicum TaxID=1758255 RepID=UPI00082FFAAA|nr:hypothetical protein [Halorubrum aethiopicum]
MKRRAVLAAVGVTGLSTAGCLRVPGRDGRSDSCADGTHFSLQRVTASHVQNEFTTYIESLPYATRTLVARALESETGAATSRSYYSLHPPKEYVVTESTDFYRVEATDLDATETTGYVYSVDLDVDESSLPNDTRIHAFTDLPAHDRESLLSAVGNPHLLHAPHYSFSAVFAYENEELRDRSMFVPETDSRHLRWNDVLLRLVFDERRTVEITSTTVSTELVAGSPEAFFGHIRRERGTVLDPLTDRQRDVITQAIDGTYTECRPYSDAFGDLRGQLTDEDGRHDALARYDGDWYFVHLSR